MGKLPSAVVSSVYPTADLKAMSPCKKKLSPLGPKPLTLITLSLLIACSSLVWTMRVERLPDFAIGDTSAKKQMFFEFLRAKVERSNSNINIARARLAVHRSSRALQDLPWLEQRFIVNLADSYDIPFDEDTDFQGAIAELMLRVDTIPTALALVQAAKESAWGTSKFATQGNNLFGQQCFVQECGFLPSARITGRQHEVARFNSADASVDAYLHNLNTHVRYTDLRAIRALARANNTVPTGSTLANGLMAYSERGADYIAEVKAMIRQNGLE